MFAVLSTLKVIQIIIDLGGIPLQVVQDLALEYLLLSVPPQAWAT